MAEVNMPRLSDTMQEGTITRWLKKPGDQVKRGDVVAEVETDKASMEIESFSTGVLEQILVQEGETAPIGQPIALIGSGADARKQTTASSMEGRKNSQSAATATAVHQELPAVQVNAVVEQAGRNGVSIKASPLARRIAEEHSIDLNQVKGSGPGGRIVRDDIEEIIEQRSAAPVQAAAPVVQAVQAQAVSTEDADVITMTTMQKTIARRLTESKQNVPHFYISSEIDLTDALELRQKLNAHGDGVKISVNDLVIKACAQALEKFPEVNASYKDGQFILHKHINVGIAVDIPSGLVVPVIRDAQQKGLRTIAREAKALVAKAQAGKLIPTDLEAGTFSISNLGMMDVSEFVAVINPPQAAILAVAAARKTYVPIDNQPVIRDIMRVTISADHRILYGAAVARFLQEIKRQLQDPYLLLG